MNGTTKHDVNSHYGWRNVMMALGMISVLSAAVISPVAQAVSAKDICDQPVFKLWKSQQAQRLWEPDAETLELEKQGKLFVYNCLTDAEVDDFFRLHGNRLHNAHFYPILKVDKSTGEIVEEDGDC